jgi:uncharacterized protein (TIGR00299 family) protein
VLYIECAAGAAGDMLLGAFVDAGLPVDVLKQALGGLVVDHELRVSRVMRAGVSATRVEVIDREAALRGAPSSGAAQPAHTHAGAHDHPHTHDHAPTHDHPRSHEHRPGDGGHHHHPPGIGHRSLAEIERLIGTAALSPRVQTRAVELIGRLAQAEADIHQMPLQDVHLHEVGAVDSIIDIVGVVVAFDWFGIDEVVVSPVNVGGGTVDIAHGTFPVPAPATARLIAGAPVYSAGPQVELLTPTGALLLTGFATRFGSMPAMTIDRVGYGAGTRDFPSVPNVVRLFVGARAAGEDAVSSASGAETVISIACEIDDMSPQLFGPAMDRLFAAGALDVFLTPVQMKKNRPGTLVTVLATAETRAALVDVLFAETTTIGVRFTTMTRETLERRWEEVAVEGGTARMKIATRAGRVLNVMPELDDCLRIATATGRPVKDVQDDARRAWHDRDSPKPSAGRER